MGCDLVLQVMWTIAGILMCHVTTGNTGWAEENQDLVSTMDVEAVVGRTATLPCDIEPGSKDERVYMVLWFRSAGGKPIYSFDVRGRSFNKALHWSDPLAFGRRAYFVTMSNPSSLTVESVQLDDEGIYRCRVDFKNSPTRNFQIRLSIVVPPHQLLLYDERGHDVAGVIGPLEEGGNFTLLCELRGGRQAHYHILIQGRPKPSLTWLINNTTRDEHTILKDDGMVIVSRITVSSVDRGWLNSSVRCRASNTPLLSPNERMARIEMHLRPKSVMIISKPGLMSSESEVSLSCIASGSRPPATITWFKENRRYTKGKQNEYINETSSTSVLTMVPRPDDDGTILRCRAENPILKHTLEDSFKMNIVYKPVVSMSLGSTLNANDIKEGDDVYFECNIKANPKEHKISWFHNEQLVTQNISSGVFISTKSLVIQKVGRSNAGLYGCRATNRMGETGSQPVYLRVQYAPICSESSPVLIGARLDEPLRVKCTVSADPSEITFYWQFNNSGESFQVSPARYVTTGGTSSELRYRAASERDYGALLCRATNAVGSQQKPCVYQIVPAARPSPPRNCTATRISKKQETHLSVRCIPGYDGGLLQHFYLEAIGDEPLVLANSTAKSVDDTEVSVSLNVSWSQLQGLSEDKVLAVVARNSKGSSDPVVFKDLVFRDAAKRIEETRSFSHFPAAAALAALAAVITAVGAVVVLCMKRRTTTETTSKRPSQSVVQLDAQGRRYLIAYPHPEKLEPKPDILNPKAVRRPLRPVGSLSIPTPSLLSVEKQSPYRCAAPPTPIHFKQTCYHKDSKKLQRRGRNKL